YLKKKISKPYLTVCTNKLIQPGCFVVGKKTGRIIPLRSESHCHPEMNLLNFVLSSSIYVVIT
ncbi:Uncharacterized protein APZ42_007632, partial [Daphnia magna]